MTTRARSTRKASQRATAITAPAATNVILEPGANSSTSRVPPPNTSLSAGRSSKRQTRLKDPLSGKSVSFGKPDAPDHGHGRSRKEPVIPPAALVTTPPTVPITTPPVTCPTSPYSPFSSGNPSNPVNSAAVTLPPAPSHLSSNCRTYSLDKSDDEYRPDEEYQPDDESENSNLVAEAAQMALDDGLEPGITMRSEGLASLLRDKLSGVSSASASDVWYFMVPASDSTLEGGHIQKRFSGSYERPEAKTLECYLCGLKNESRPFANGATSSMRRHLRSKHTREWLVTCVSLKLKGWEEKAAHLQKLSPGTEDSELTRRAPPFSCFPRTSMPFYAIPFHSYLS